MKRRADTAKGRFCPDEDSPEPPSGRDGQEDALEAVLATFESPEDGGVKCAVHFAKDALDGPCVGERRLVRPLAAEGVVNIGQARKSGGWGNGVAGEAGRGNAAGPPPVGGGGDGPGPGPG